MPPLTDYDPDDALCDVSDCGQLARYVETGDGRAAANPRLRCHDHKPDSGLWRDIASAVAKDVIDADPDSEG